MNRNSSFMFAADKAGADIAGAESARTDAARVVDTMAVARTSVGTAANAPDVRSSTGSGAATEAADVLSSTDADGMAAGSATDTDGAVAGSAAGADGMAVGSATGTDGAVAGTVAGEAGVSSDSLTVTNDVNSNLFTASTNVQDTASPSSSSRNSLNSPTQNTASRPEQRPYYPKRPAYIPTTKRERYGPPAEQRSGGLRKPDKPPEARPGIPILGGRHSLFAKRTGKLAAAATEHLWDQARAPLAEALQNYKKSRVVSFDVPGHKQGKGNKSLVEYFGEACVSIDVNSMKPLDNLIHPVSVIKQAEDLAAQAFGAGHAFLMVGGTSSSVQTMVMTTCKDGDKIIMPRNVHRSAINALILSGAVPVYVDPGTDQKLGIPLGMSITAVKEAIHNNPDAKAILVNNPTYYGVCGDLRQIVELAHAAGMLVLADEAHGTHLYFGKDLPVPAMAAGADMAAVSMHKTGGSFTQSSLLLVSPSFDPGEVRRTINLTQTTSASYLLMASLDLSRRNLALNGVDIFNKVVNLAEYARHEVNAIGGYYAFNRELCNGDNFYAFDPTKLSIHTRSIGLAGIEVYDLLRDEYNIQIEFGDLGNMLAILSVGDRAMEIERLIAALAEIKRLYARDPIGMLENEYVEPVVVTTPRTAFYAPKHSLPLANSLGHISGEFVMCYPPGIPILAPGEKITAAALDYICYAKEHGANMTGTVDLAVNNILVLD